MKRILAGITGPAALTDAQITDALQAAGVEWQWIGPNLRSQRMSTCGSTDADKIIAGVRTLLAASPADQVEDARSKMLMEAIAACQKLTYAEDRDTIYGQAVTDCMKAIARLIDAAMSATPPATDAAKESKK